MKRSEIRSLIETIYRHGSYEEAGDRAIEQLVREGERALDEFLSEERECQTDLDPRDLSDARMSVLRGFAETAPDSLIAKLRSDERDYYTLLWCLGWASGEQSIDVLLAGLKHEEPEVRLQAAESLMRRRVERTAPALVEALKDRSSQVKSTVVYAMACHKIFRRPEGLPALEKISQSKQIRQHSPMTVTRARRVIELISEEDQAAQPAT